MMNCNEVYKFLRLYIKLLRQTSDRVKIVNVDPATEEVEIKIWNEIGEIVNHFHTHLWNAAKIIEAKTTAPN